MIYLFLAVLLLLSGVIVFIFGSHKSNKKIGVLIALVGLTLSTILTYSMVTEQQSVYKYYEEKGRVVVEIKRIPNKHEYLVKLGDGTYQSVIFNNSEMKILKDSTNKN